MCLIIAATVTYLTVKMTRTFPDKRIWALVAFTVITFFVGIITLSAGITLITKANKEDVQPVEAYTVTCDPDLLQVEFTDSTDRKLLSTLLAQSSDGLHPPNFTITSSSLNEASNSALTTLIVEFQSNENGGGTMNMTITDMSTSENVGDYEISWTSDSYWLQPTDCFEMPRAGDGMFGGAEMYLQGWPINSWDKYMSFYLSGDMYADAQQYGSVLERYWLSTTGAAIFVEEDVPLHVSTEQYRLCLKGSFDDSPYRENSASHRGLPFLKYRIILSPNARQTHEYIFLKVGLLKRPTGLPDTRMIKSPIWSTWARYKQNVSQDIVLQYASEIENNGFTNSQLEIDDGYEISYGDYTFDPDKFPDAAGMISELHSRGFRVTTWVTPFVNPRSQNFDSPEYFVKNSDGEAESVVWWDGAGRMIDYTSEESCEWYVSNLENVRTSTGVDSFKFDAGEINYLTKIEGYETEKFLRNPGTYTRDYVNCAHRLGNLIEVRAAWRNQDLPIFVRMMDKDSNWTPAKGLKTIIPTALTFSLLGYPYVLPDMIGGNGYENGFLGQYLPERELYIRWVEMTAFLPSMQFSVSPWQYDEEVTDISRNYVNLHETVVYEELVKSFKSYVDGTSGMGAIRPLWWIAPQDRSTYQIDDEFLVGDKYLVAPIVDNATRSRDIYLPGPLGYGEKHLKWLDKLRNGDVYEGGMTLYDYNVDIDEISWFELQ